MSMEAASILGFKKELYERTYWLRCQLTRAHIRNLLPQLNAVLQYSRNANAVARTAPSQEGKLNKPRFLIWVFTYISELTHQNFLFFISLLESVV